MTDRKKDDANRPQGADAGREGFGDDGGTRVGRPDAARGAEGGRGPSSQPVKEGLEGAVFEDEGGKRASGRGNSGVGSEAAEGVHDAKARRDPSDSSGVESAEDEIGSRGGMDRRGSEPLVNRDREHKSGYGGEGGEPRTSSDQR